MKRKRAKKVPMASMEVSYMSRERPSSPVHDQAVLIENHVLCMRASHDRGYRLLCILH